jgi:hypothetical protein
MNEYMLLRSANDVMVQSASMYCSVPWVGHQSIRGITRKEGSQTSQNYGRELTDMSCVIMKVLQNNTLMRNVQCVFFGVGILKELKRDLDNILLDLT